MQQHHQNRISQLDAIDDRVDRRSTHFYLFALTTTRNCNHKSVLILVIKSPISSFAAIKSILNMDSDLEQFPVKKPRVSRLPTAVNKAKLDAQTESVNSVKPQPVRRKIVYLEDDDFSSSYSDDDDGNDKKQSFFYGNNQQQKKSPRCSPSRHQVQQPKEEDDLQISSFVNSQDSQLCTQDHNKFTYHSSFDDDGLEALTRSLSIKPQNDRFLRGLPSVIQEQSFFHSIRGSFQAGLYQTVVDTLNNSYQYFVAPSARNLDFLRQFLRCYTKLTVERFGVPGGTGQRAFKKFYVNYLNFFRYFFNQLGNSRNWSRPAVLSLLHKPNSNEAPYHLIFSLMGHILRLCLKYKQFKLNPLVSVVSLNLQLPFELFKIVINFLCDDFGRFLVASHDYAHDLVNLDVKPLIVRLMWTDDVKPDFMSRGMKLYISYLVKTIKLDIAEMGAPMMKLFADLSEVIRICTGNVRPYLELSSIVPHELYDAMKEGGLTRDKVINVLYLLEEYPWLKAQFCVALLSSEYNKISLTQHFRNKYNKLSLRLILCTFLAGDVDRFKWEMAEFGDKRMALKKERQMKTSFIERVEVMNMDCGDGNTESMMRLNEKNDDELAARKSHRIREKRALYSDLPVSTAQDSTNYYMNRRINKSNLEVLYRKYSSTGQKTSFGGNSLHIAARRGDLKWIEPLFGVMMADVNAAETQGYTPLNDAARLGHEKCVEKLIDCSRAVGIVLDYETGSLVDGNTALHNAVMSGKERSIRKILECGGRHLLKIRNFAGETAEQLLPEHLKTLPEEIAYSGMTNLLPSLTDVADVEFYGRTVAALITAYLKTIKLDTFVNLYQDYQEELSEDEVVEECSDFEQHFRNQFAHVWGREPTEQDVDQLVDDVEMLPRIRQFVHKFVREQMQSAHDDDQEDGLPGHFGLLLMDVHCLMNKLGVKFEDEK